MKYLIQLLLIIAVSSPVMAGLGRGDAYRTPFLDKLSKDSNSVARMHPLYGGFVPADKKPKDYGFKKKNTNKPVIKKKAVKIASFEDIKSSKRVEFIRKVKKETLDFYNKTKIYLKKKFSKLIYISKELYKEFNERYNS